MSQSKQALTIQAMAIMQQVSFNSIVEFFDFLPNGEREITLVLRDIILESIPEVTENLSYNVPFYKRHKSICFVWPSSVLWGNKKSYDGVRLGFTNGHLIDDPLSYLDRGDRKQVSYRDFLRTDDINENLLRKYLLQAADIDALFKKNR